MPNSDLEDLLKTRTFWIGKKVTVPDSKDLPKEISVQFKPFNSVYQLDFEYYDPAEVNTF